MKIKTLKFGLYLLCIMAVFVACEEDEGPTQEFVEEDRTEQQAKDKDSLLNYFTTHYYNSGDFSTGINHRIDDIVITELPKDDDGNYLPLPNPAENTMLIDDIITRTTTYLEVEYEYYFLDLNQGGGKAPEFTDKVRVRYEGSLVTNDEIFDQVSTPINLDLYGVAFGTGAITGWQRIMPEFNSALDFAIGDDNIVNYNDYGLGVMFIPSGLGYFSFPRTGIPVYSNLVFKFELLQVQTNDHDNDGIPSYREDYNGNLDPFDDDTDEDGVPDYIDLDDDGDLVLTRNELVPTTYVVDTNVGETEPMLDVNEFEISREEVDGIITIETVKMIDTNTSGKFDHLDEEVTIDYSEEDEDN